MNWSTLLFLEMFFHLGGDSWWCVCCCQRLSEVEWHQACRGDCQYGAGITKSYVFLSFAAPSGASTAAQDWNTHRYIREKILQNFWNTTKTNMENVAVAPFLHCAVLFKPSTPNFWLEAMLIILLVLCLFRSSGRWCGWYNYASFLFVRTHSSHRI